MAELGISFSPTEPEEDAGAEAVSGSLSGSLSSDSDEELHLVLRYGVYGKTGRRKTMEDTHFIAYQAPQHDVDADEDVGPESIGPAVGFFSVFDGHGGDGCSEYLAEHMFPHIVEAMPPLDPEDDPDDALDELALALSEGYAATEEAFLSLAESSAVDSGSTAVSALVFGNLLAVANVGDSEAILSRSGDPVVLSVIHNPAKNDDEEARVIEQGGRVYKKRVALPSVPAHICNIAVSRAFGDMMFKNTPTGEPSGLTCEPDTATHIVDPRDEFLILACDGVWDVMDYSEAILTVAEALGTSGYDPEVAVKALVDNAYAKGSTDNITALVVLFDFVTTDDLVEQVQDTPNPALQVDVNGEAPSDDLLVAIADAEASGPGFSPIERAVDTGTIKMAPGGSLGISFGTSGLNYASDSDNLDDEDDVAVTAAGRDSDSTSSSDEDLSDDDDEKALWPGMMPDYEGDAPLNGAKRNVPGTARDELYAWPPGGADGQVGHLEVQQYLQELIRHDPADIETLVTTPDGIAPVLWQYEHLRQLTMELSHLAVMLEECGCSPLTCDKMKVTEEWMFLCAAHKEPKECPAIDYICHTLDGATALLNSNKYFPSRVNLNPSEARSSLTSVARRLYRICAHAFFNHPDAFEEFEAETHLTERFAALASRHRLVGKKMRIIPPKDQWADMLN